jgi:hypothetical protein
MIPKKSSVRLNLFAIVRGAYKYAKKNRSDVSVHWEDFDSGEGGDALRLYDEDEARKICTFTGLVVMLPDTSQYPVYIMPNDPIPATWVAWIEETKAQHATRGDASWKLW